MPYLQPPLPINPKQQMRGEYLILTRTQCAPPFIAELLVIRGVHKGWGVCEGATDLPPPFPEPGAL